MNFVAVRVQKLRGLYPGQFWLMFWGMLVSTIGSSMIWPFLMIYIAEKLDLQLTVAASMMTINSISGLVMSFFVGPIADSLGRKWIMIISLCASAGIYMLYPHINSLPFLAVVMILSGAFSPLYRVGADAMIADLVPAEKRPDAYALLRMNNNIGVAIGPAIGGFIAMISYDIAFYTAALGTIIYTLLLIFFARETMPRLEKSLTHARSIGKEMLDSFTGYFKVIKDKPFISSTIAFCMNMIGMALIWMMLGIYAKRNFGVPENQYGWLATTNAVMVICFQLLVTRFTKKQNPLKMMGLGALFYTIAVASVAFGTNFWSFWMSMVIMTIGELILMPTSTNYVASLAPADMRGRYMGLFSLTWGIAMGTGPLFGGLLSDTFGPRTMWFGGACAGLMGVILYLQLWRQKVRSTGVPVPAK